MTEAGARDPLAVFGDEGWLRNHLHTPRGARVLNFFVVPLWRVVPPRGFAVLTTIGRVTGKRRQQPIRLVFSDDTAYAVAIVGEHSDWLRNALQASDVRLRARRRNGTGKARRLRDEAENDAARTFYCEQENLADFVECFLHVRGRPSRRRIAELHLRWFRMGTPIAIDLHRRTVLT